MGSLKGEESQSKERKGRPSPTKRNGSANAQKRTCSGKKNVLWIGDTNLAGGVGRDMYVWGTHEMSGQKGSVTRVTNRRPVGALPGEFYSVKLAES